MRHLRFSLALCAFAAIHATAQWVHLKGPFGSDIRDLSVGSSGVYAASGTTPRVFRSTDNGLTWSYSSKGIPSYALMYSVHVDGHDVYAGGVNGVYHSADDGENWTASTTTLGSAAVCLTTTGTSVLAGTFGSGIYRSEDKGKTWTPVFGVTSKIVNSLLSADGIVYAGSDSGVFFSENGGTTWVKDADGLVGTSVNVVMPFGGLLYAGLYSGVHRSPGKGERWKAYLTGMLSNYSTYALLGVKPGVILAGVSVGGGETKAIYMSKDSGSTWEASMQGLPSNSVKDLVWAGPSILAAINGGVFRSEDSGASWIPSVQGMENVRVRDLMEADGKLYAGTELGMQVLGANGEWSGSFKGLATSRILTLMRSGTNVFAGTAEHGLYRSQDNGATWKYTGALTRDGSNVSALFQVGNRIFAGNNSLGYLSRSDDDGATWVKSDSGLPALSVNEFAFQNGKLFLAGDKSGVMVSEDTGLTWKPSRNGFDAPPPGSSYYAKSLLTLGNDLFAGTDDGAFRSGDGGDTWTPVKNGMRYAVTDMIADGDVIYAVASAAVYRSTDKGATWVAKSGVSAGGGPDIGANKLVIHGTDLYAASLSDGIWKRPLADMVGIHELQRRDGSAFGRTLRSGGSGEFDLTLARAGKVSIELYGVDGVFEAVLFAGALPAGPQRIRLTGRPTVGAHILRLAAEGSPAAHALVSVLP
ncbi:MAG: hypothetical protein JWO30_4377 [Fibrobacteres bacterium]|nr:hypothetical protein [Fibrobacterota bacterium]